jgi:hypothetical protein
MNIEQSKSLPLQARVEAIIDGIKRPVEVRGKSYKHGWLYDLRDSANVIHVNVPEARVQS